MRIGLIGAGNMASALARGLGEPALVADVDQARAESLAAEIGGRAAASNAEAAQGSDVVILCHKPPQVAAVAEEVRDHAGVVVSILGGTPLATIESAYPDRPVYRFMPSIPVEVRQGVVCYAPGTHAGEGPEAEVRELFGRLGTLVELPESSFDVATAVMSCSPAFYALVVESLVDAGVAHGLPPDVAGTMAVQALAGTAAVLREGENDTRELRRRVTSPGGMTARGLAALERGGVRAAFEDAVAAVVGGQR
ncbi:MAG TPA: pyrroline-5-carboxylate reductase [Thermoleophilaceae bacterium]|nr:pyrroline-5-carboxylate reductase [Thermoleophilaceae bacterium]